MKNSILSQALESLETPVPQALPPAEAPAPVAPQAAAPTHEISRENTDAVIERKLDAMSRDNVVMNAPLSTIFTRALNIQLAKKNVVTNEFDGTTSAATTQSEAVATEGQAQDAYFSAQARRIFDDNKEVETRIYTTDPVKPEVPENLETGGNGTKLVAAATQEETIKFFNSNDLEGVEPKFVFYRDVGVRTDGAVRDYWDDQKMIALNEKGSEVTYVVESIEVVVRTRKVDLKD